MNQNYQGDSDSNFGISVFESVNKVSKGQPSSQTGRLVLYIHAN